MNANLMKNKVRITEYGTLAKAGEKGIQLTAKAISNLAQQDAEKAVNLMSQLSGKGLLDMETMIKVFNGRYGLIVSNMLNQINGNMDGYIDRINNATNLTKDYETQMNNLNNQWKLFKNRLMGANSELISVAKPTLDFLALIGNKALDGFNNDLGRSIFTIGTLTAGSYTAVIGLGSFVNILKTATSSISLFGYTLSALPFAQVVVGISALISTIMYIKREHDKYTETLLSNKRELRDNAFAVDDLRIRYSSAIKTIDQAKLTNGLSEFGKLNSVIGELTTASDTLVSSLEAVYSALNAKIPTQTLNVEFDTKTKEGYKKLVASYMKEASDLEKKQKDSPFMFNLNDKNRLDTLRSEGVRLQNEITKIDKRLWSAKTKTAEDEMKKQEEILSAKVSYTNAVNKEIFGGIIDIIPKLKVKTKEGLMDYLTKNMESFGVDFKKTIKDVEAYVGKTFTIEQLKTPKYLQYMVDMKENQRLTIDALDKLKNSKDNSIKEMAQKEIERLKVQRRMYEDSLDIDAEAVGKKERSGISKVFLDLKELTMKYEEAKSKAIKVDQDQLTLLLEQKKALKDSFDIEKSKKEQNLLQEYANTWKSRDMLTLDALKKRRDSLTDSLAKYQKGDTTEEVKRKYEAEFEERAKIDELLASSVDYTNSIAKNQYDIAMFVKSAKEDLFNMNYAYEDLYDGQLKLNELANKRLEIGQLESNKFKNELELVTQRYSFEMKMLKMKEEFLLRQYNLTSDTASLTFNTNMATQTKALSGFSSGGFTGKGNDKDVAGVTHANEYVIPAWMVKKYPTLISTLESDRTGKKGYYDGGFVGKMLANNTNTKITLPVDKDKLNTPLYGIDSFFKSLGFKMDGKASFNKKKNSWEASFMGDDRAIGVIYNGDSKNFIVSQYMKKGVSTNLGKDSKKNYLDKEEYVGGVESFSGSKNIMGTGSIGSTTSGSKSTGTSSTSSTGSSKTTTIAKDITVTKELVTQLEVAEKILTSNKSLNEEELNRSKKALEYMKLQNDILMLKEQFIQNIANLTSNSMKAELEYNAKQTAYQNNLTKLEDFKASLFRDSSEKSKVDLETSKGLLQNKKDEFSNMEDIYNKRVDAVKASKEYYDLETDEDRIKLVRMMEEQFLVEKKLKNQELTTAELEHQNKVIQDQYDRYSKMTSVGMDFLEKLSKGEAFSFDIGQARTGATNAITKVAMGGKMNTNDKLNTGAYALGIIDNFMKLDGKSRMQQLESEQKVLDLRLQGAKTEEEKVEIQKQQLQMQKDMIDAQMKQQTSFLGQSGGAGGLLGGAFGGAMAGASLGPYGALAGAVIGGVSGLIAGNEAKDQAEAQKRQLEEQARMTKYLEEIAKQTETTNTYMERMASQGSKIGIRNVVQEFQDDIKRNPTKYQIGASTTGSWTNSYKEGWGWNEHTVNDTKMVYGKANLAMFGATESDLGNLAKVNGLQSQISAKIAQQQEIMAKAKAGTGTHGTHQYWQGEYAQAEADMQALKEMQSQLQKLTGDVAKQAPYVYSQYFGGTLEKIMEADGKTISGYYAKWSDMLGKQLEDSYSATTKGLLVNAQNTTSNLLSGLTRMYIVNYSKMDGIATEINKTYEELAKNLGSSADKMNMEEVGNQMARLVALTEQQKAKQLEVNKASDNFLYMWLSKGGKITDVVDSMNEGMKGVYNSMTSGLKSDSFKTMATGLGDLFGGQFTDAMVEQVMNGKLTQTFKSMYESLSSGVKDLTIQSASNMFAQMNSASVQLENERRRIESYKSIFSMDKNIEYTQENNAISYNTGSSKDTTVINNINITLSSDFVFTENEESATNFARKIANPLKNILDNEK